VAKQVQLDGGSEIII